MRAEATLFLALATRTSALSLSSAVRSVAPPASYVYQQYNDAMTMKKLGSSDILVSSCETRDSSHTRECCTGM